MLSIIYMCVSYLSFEVCVSICVCVCWKRDKIFMEVHPFIINTPLVYFPSTSPKRRTAVTLLVSALQAYFQSDFSIGLIIKFMLNRLFWMCDFLLIYLQLKTKILLIQVWMLICMTQNAQYSTYGVSMGEFNEYHWEALVVNGFQSTLV